MIIATWCVATFTATSISLYALFLTIGTSSYLIMIWKSLPASVWGIAKFCGVCYTLGYPFQGWPTVFMHKQLVTT